MIVEVTMKQILTGLDQGTGETQKYLYQHDFLPAEAQTHAHFDLHNELHEKPNHDSSTDYDLNNLAELARTTSRNYHCCSLKDRSVRSELSSTPLPSDTIAINNQTHIHHYYHHATYFSKCKESRK